MKEKRVLKKIILLLTLILILNSYLLVAGSISTEENNSAITTQITYEENFKEKINEQLQKEITIPDNLKIVSEILIGINEESTKSTLSWLIILISWITICVLLKIIIQTLPSFKENIKSWGGALLITSIISIFGGINKIGLKVIYFKYKIGIGDSHNLEFIIIGTIILVVTYILINKTLKEVTKKSKVEENKNEGFIQGTEQ